MLALIDEVLIVLRGEQNNDSGVEHQQLDEQNREMEGCEKGVL